MKKILTTVYALALSFTCANAQNATYHLPKTGVKVTMLVEKTSYTPGDLAAYSQRFLKKEVSQEKSETYRIISTDMKICAVPDTARIYTAHIDAKHNIQKLALSEDNILLAINAEPKTIEKDIPFVSGPKATHPDPYKYLSQEILSSGSRAKMAELCAKEIYDIRESRNELNKGEADYMPKDGEQLRIMLKGLETQENAISQIFEGVTYKDTTQIVLTYIPEKAVSNVPFFRFSKYYGVLANDDLAGEPYFITIEDLKSQPEHIIEPGKKAPKDETGIWIVLPGKARITLSNTNAAIKTIEASLAQFGEVENLNDPLFGKKINTSIILHPYNGGIDKINSEYIK